ncbi:MAG: hypothetical protein ND895_11235 [Pyrinomonadaceae bacterium]|nr:hypothetical protein [Pyrinomonadaceae bacterium]
MPEMQTIGMGMVWRISETKNEHGAYLPPWKEITITNIFGFKRMPVIGDKVTVVLLGSDISPLDLRITKTEKKEDACNERLPAWWEVQLEPIHLRKLFDIEPMSNRNAEFPFEVVVLYPAVKVARQISKGQLTKGMLPTGVSLNTVKAAIDLTRDLTPDVLVIDYCCEDTRKAEPCDYTCGKTFKKVRNAWKLIDTSAPC